MLFKADQLGKRRVLKWNKKICRKRKKGEKEKQVLFKITSMPLRKYVVDKAVNFFNKVLRKSSLSENQWLTLTLTLFSLNLWVRPWLNSNI